MNHKFRYLEIVKINETPENIEDKIVGLEGTVLGYDLVDDTWIYSVDIEGIEELYSLEEKELNSTGRINKESNFYG